MVKTVETLELKDLLENNTCTCTHSITRDHLLGKCYALNFDGLIYKACECKQTHVVKKFFLRVEIKDLCLSLQS